MSEKPLENNQIPNLQWRDETGQPQLYYLSKPEVVIGRHASSDICINDPAVSRVHALVTLQRVRYAIEDQESKLGTFVNGQRLERPKMLEQGDQIQIGPVELIFYDPLSTATFVPLAKTPEVSSSTEPRLSLDLQTGKVWADGKELTLSPKEYSLLAFLYRNRERSCSRDEIRAAVWSERFPDSVTDPEIDALVGRLRRKIEPNREQPIYIVTVRSIKGFRFEGGGL